ncbi:MAG TPA: response regulator [Spirochaetia bacterium]|nr:response regulator [Spirochaetia bacterium]
MYKILLVEDEELERQFLRHLVQTCGCPVEVAGEAKSGKEAVEMAADVHPDIILMDIRMPGLDGLEATRLIKARQPAVEVIILTAHGTFSYSQQAIKSKVADYLLKPVQPEELAEALDRVIAGLEAQTPGVERFLATAPPLNAAATDLVKAIRYCDPAAARQAVAGLLSGFLRETERPEKEQLAALAFEMLVTAGQGLLAGGAGEVALSSQQSDLAREIRDIGTVSGLTAWAERMYTAHIRWIRDHRATGDQAVIGQVKEYLRRHYREEITLARAAGSVHLNPAYLSRLFKQKSGQSFVAYLTLLRLENAKELLLSSDRTIDQIAADVGFRNNSYFTTVFRKREGITPSEFRSRPLSERT